MGGGAHLGASPVSDTTGSAARPSVAFLPEMHFAVSGAWFPHPVDSFSRAKYFIDAQLNSEVFFLSVGELFFWLLRYDVQAGFGRQKGPIVLDPKDINYNIIPAFELRRWGYLAQFGLQHRCFHEIDRKLTPTVYWNMPYLTIGSANMRPGDFGRDRSRREWDVLERVAWSVSWGWFVTDFFDALESNQVNGGHYFKHHLDAEARCAVLRTQRWDCVVGAGTALWRSGKRMYWAQELQVQGIYRRDEKGFAPFVRYHFDLGKNVPLFSRDRLVEIGVAAFL